MLNKICQTLKYNIINFTEFWIAKIVFKLGKKKNRIFQEKLKNYSADFNWFSFLHFVLQMLTYENINYISTFCLHKLQNKFLSNGNCV